MSYPDCPRVSKAMHKHPKYQNTVTLTFALELERELNAMVKHKKEITDVLLYQGATKIFELQAEIKSLKEQLELQTNKHNEN